MIEQDLNKYLNYRKLFHLKIHIKNKKLFDLISIQNMKQEEINNFDLSIDEKVYFKSIKNY
jgi:hypothetical protein